MAKFPRRDFIVLTAPIVVFVGVVFGLLNRQPQFSIERVKIVPLSPPSGRKNLIWEPDTQVTVYMRYTPSSLKTYARYCFSAGNIDILGRPYELTGLYDQNGKRIFFQQVEAGVGDGLDGPTHYALEYKFDLSKVPQSVKIVRLQSRAQLDGVTVPVVVTVRGKNKPS